MITLFKTFRRYKEPILEKTFQIEALNDSNEKNNLLIENFGMNLLDVFKEHYNKFRPVLNEIKTSKIENLESVKDLKQFISGDCHTLFQLPFNNESRNAFYREIDAAYPNLPKFSKFNEIIHSLNGSNDPSVNTSIYFRDEVELIQQTFCESRIWGHNISKHPSYDVVTTILERHFGNCTDAQLDTLLYFSEFYEKIALVTLEPWMISVLGNALFFKVFIPLHYSGAFHIIATDIVQKVKSSRITFPTIFQNYSNKIINLHQVLRPVLYFNTTPYLMLCYLVNLGYSYFRFYFLTLPDSEHIERSKEPTATELVTRHMNYENRGINNTYYQTFVSNVEKIAFEIGRLGGTISRNIMDGAISRYEDVFRDAAREYDRRQDSGNEDQKPEEES
jgi:hypothetical protein